MHVIRCRGRCAAVVAMLCGCAPSTNGPAATPVHATEPEGDPTKPAADPQVLAHPRLDRAPSPELAVVVTERGVVALDSAGETAGVLLSTQPVWCRVDPRAEVLWMITIGGEGSDTYPEGVGSLLALDLRTDADPVTVLPSVPEVVVIAYPDERLNESESHQFRDGIMIHMADPPRAEAILGCEGDMSWYCFEDEQADDDFDFDKAAQRHLEARGKVVEGLPLATAELAEWVARGQGRKASPADPGRAPAPRRVEGVPEAGCRENPEDCGQAEALFGSRFWRVVVSNDRGDFFHETTQLYDPKAAEFVDPARPAQRSKSPLPESDDAFDPMFVSPSGELALSYDRLVRLEGGVVAEVAGVCGFWGGGFVL